MHISAIAAKGYRNLQGTIGIPRPLAVLVGENNTGKSNAIDALRLVLEPEHQTRGRFWARPEDFAHDGRGEPMTDELEIAVTLSDLTPAEDTLMLTARASTEAGGDAKLRMRAKIGDDGRVRSTWYGGNSENADLDPLAREAVRFIYLHPLRDAAADLRPGRDNRLVPLIKALIPEDHPDHQAVIDAMGGANEALDQIGRIGDARTNVHERLEAMTGGGRFAAHSNLAFEDPRFDRIVGQLRAKIGELAPLEMAENGLGYNNILYMAVLLSALAEQPQEGDPVLRVLLVEEPEAHLHPQLQDLLMRFLEEQAETGQQVIATSHSPNFASAAKVERLSVVTSEPDANGNLSRLPVDFGMEERELRYLHRFLDVTKAGLFFAKGVILVEGTAEQLLVPVFAKLIDKELTPAGISVINIGGVAFNPFAGLFGEDRLPYRLTMISDSDPIEDPDNAGQTKLSPRAELLQISDDRDGGVGVFLTQRTLEWDLAAIPENRPLMLEALTELKPRVGAELTERIADLGDEDAATAILEAVDDRKGEYAQILATLLADRIASDAEVDFKLPDELSSAIAWATEPPPAPEPTADAGPGEETAPENAS